MSLTEVHLVLHITAGVSTLIAGPIAIFYNFKNTRNHRLAGQIFFYSMLYVCASAIVGYLRRPDLIFYQFLLGISVLVLAGIFRGVRAIRLMKGGSVKGYDFAYTAGLGLFGLWMLWKAAAAANGESLIFPILFAVFGIASLSDVARNLKMFLRPAAVSRVDWYALHVSSMLGAFTASTTAFLVNVGHVLPWYIQWFGPTLALLPLQIYFGRKVRGKRTATA